MCVSCLTVDLGNHGVAIWLHSSLSGSFVRLDTSLIVSVKWETAMKIRRVMSTMCWLST